MELWLVYALLTVVLYGLGEGLSKEPTTRLGSGRMLALYSLYSVPIYTGWFLLEAGWSDFTPDGVLLGIGSGLTGALGTLLWFVAIERGNASVVSGFSAAYPVVTIAAAVVGLGATLLPVQVVSIVFLLAGALLLGMSEGHGGQAEGRTWLAPMFLAVLLWGAWGVLEKLSLDAIGFSANAGLYVLSSTPVYLLVARRGARRRGPWEKAAVRGAQPALVLWAVSGVTMFLAIGLGPLAVVVPLMTMYPVVAILFRRLWMEERMSLAQKVAVGFCMTGTLIATL